MLSCIKSCVYGVKHTFIIVKVERFISFFSRLSLKVESNGEVQKPLATTTPNPL